MSLIKLAEVNSTNTWLKERCGGLSHGDCVTALRQTGGRGRIGHEWLGHEGMLPLSVLIKDIPEPHTLTLRVSLAVCRAIEPLIGERLSIKWPNDIILHGHKLCGILCESAVKCDSRCMICGVGINLTQPEEFFSASGIPHGGSLLSLTGIKADRDALAERLALLIAELSQIGLAEVADEYRQRCITLGKEVRLLGRTERMAFALDISRDGTLVCRDAEGEFSVNSGEVSVRGLMDYA